MRGRKFEIPDNLEVTNGQKVIKLCLLLAVLHTYARNADYPGKMWQTCSLQCLEALTVNSQNITGTTKLTQNWLTTRFVPEINRIFRWAKKQLPAAEIVQKELIIVNGILGGCSGTNDDGRWLTLAPLVTPEGQTMDKGFWCRHNYQ